MLFFVFLALSPGEWIETTQEDFSDGAFERNLYASQLGDGAIEFVGRWDFNNDGYIDVPAHSWIMWGSPTGYSQGNITSYAGNGGCDGADLNQDGYPELITTAMCGTIRIFWGTDTGPDPNNPQVFNVPGYNNEGIAVADLNKDGYLDLIISCLDNDNTGILWGSPAGYDLSNVTLLPVNESGFNPEVADLNKDSWLDVIVVAGNTYQGQQHYIYYGSSEGFNIEKRTTVEYGHGGPHGMSVADLNNDGWLDLVYSANIPYYAAILWGGKEVYRTSQVVEADYILPLPDRAFGGSSINHLNNDKYLDLVFFGNDGVPPRIFWGAEDGISPSRYEDLSESFGVGAGGIVADFNYDGCMDLFEYEWGGGSRFFWGPDFTPSGSFDNLGCHHGFSREVGSVYYRQNKEVYYSSVYDTKMDLNWIEYEYDASCPGSSKVRVAIRTGAHPDDFLTEASTVFSTGKDPWHELCDNERIETALMGCNQRYIQYRVTFEYDNPANLPSLEQVRINYEGELLELPSSNSAESNDVVALTVSSKSYSSWHILLSSAPATPVQLGIYDAGGRLVSTLIDSQKGTGMREFLWEGLDDQGRTAPNGVYFIRLVQQQKVENAKIMLIR